MHTRDEQNASSDTGMQKPSLYRSPPQRGRAPGRAVLAARLWDTAAARQARHTSSTCARSWMLSGLKRISSSRWWEERVY